MCKFWNCVSEDNGCACCRTSLNAEWLERADKSSVEVSVLKVSVKEGLEYYIYVVEEKVNL